MVVVVATVLAIVVITTVVLVLIVLWKYYILGNHVAITETNTRKLRGIRIPLWSSSRCSRRHCLFAAKIGFRVQGLGGGGSVCLGYRTKVRS